MTRTRLVMPLQRLDSIKIPVRISDINYGNHVGNDAFVSIIHESRVQWLVQHGHTELNAGGTGLILSDLIVEFKQQSFYGDMITVDLFAGEIARVSFELFYQLSVLRNIDNLVIANAKTTMICYDYALKKTVSVTDSLKQILHTV